MLATPSIPAVMLLRHLFARDASGRDADLSFRTRGAEVSRLEGFSDAVFGFAITLLVMSSAAPATADQLLAMRHAVIPFIASFAVLFGLWRAQFDFFRRYGLEDRQTTRLTGLLLMVVLMAIYPVRFLCTFVLDVLPTALLAHDDSMRRMMTIDLLPAILLLYGIGFTGITFLFSRLYRHAATQHAVIGLSELELFDTRLIERRWIGMATGGVALVAWCAELLVLGRDGRRDFAWNVGYAVGVPLILLNAIAQRLAVRRLARQRPVADPALPSSSLPLRAS